MGNKWDDMRYAYKESELIVKSADAVVNDMAKMLTGRLRKVESTYVLIRLKRELSDFNMQTKRWKK